MNENELTRHLVGYAAGLEPTPDGDGLRHGMGRIDRNRRIRAFGATGSAIALAVFGFISLTGGEPSAQLDVRGENPAPVDSEPELGTGSVESPADPGAGDGSGSDPTEGPDLEPASGPPVHLQTSGTTTTTVAAAEVSTTTVATTTTAPPTTAAPPATTDPPSTTQPPTTTTPTASFSASSLYGSCEEDPPYDEYSGTAAPGAIVTVTSPHSATARATADGSGHWYVRVEFPSAPVGSPFTVTAGDGTSTVSMSFVRTG